MKNEYLVVGLMSGTSLDGLDVALCRFTKNEKWEFDILDAQTFEYGPDVTKVLAYAHLLNGTDLSLLNVALGRLHGDCVKKFLDTSAARPDFISSHGHTIFHQPAKGLTLQIGSAPHIGAVVNLPVVADFRSLDVALGGQGAPLVPIGDLHLFSQYDHCLNLGGIANVSTRSGNDIQAFDICICNMALNYLAQQLGQTYDKGGELAAAGEVNLDLLSELDRLPFFSQQPPRSLGKEFFETEIMPLLKTESQDEVKHLLRTFVEHIAIQVGRSVGSGSEMLVTGGGAFNSFLIERIAANTGVRLMIPDPKIIAFKEALIFAFLGVLRWREEVNCLASVTGASRDSTGGVIYRT